MKLNIDLVTVVTNQLHAFKNKEAQVSFILIPVLKYVDKELLYKGCRQQNK